MLQDFFAKDFPTLVRDVKHHAFRAVSVAFGMTDNAFVLFKRYQSVINGRSANLRPAVKFSVTNFRDDIVPTAFVLQNEAEQYKIVTVHLYSLILLVFQVGIIDLTENYIFFAKKIARFKKIRKKLIYIPKKTFLVAIFV
jgi:hypothetical protein